MTKNCKAAMAAGVAGGYVLGRTRKAKLAFAVATYLVGRRFSLSPSQLVTEGVERLRQTPQFQELSDQFKGQILTAGREACAAAAGRRVADMTDKLQERTERLRGGGPPAAEDKAGKGGEPPGRRPPGRKAAGAAAGGARRAADTAGGTGTAARKAAGGAGAAARGTAGGAGTTARKTSRSAGAAARRTAAGAGSAARKATTAQRAAAKKKAATRTSGDEGRSSDSGARR